MPIAITRGVSPDIEQCELTHLAREPIDLERAVAQHARYEEVLASLGCDVRSLPAEPGLPDSVFVEDAALVFDEVAVITRPGAASRRPETASIADALRPFRELVHIAAPGTIDGGDVLVVDRRVYIGRSQRTNAEGLRQVRAALEPRGYVVTPVDVKGCLHLKSAVNRVGPQTLLINRDYVPAAAFGDVDFIDVAPEEPGAAGALPIGDSVIYSESYPRTRERLERAGIRIAPVDLSELVKAEAGVTCCSLVFDNV
ncbi:MAG: dimethylargininase [Gemmatimonadetes bacterium]|nr:dimethylargininase [Gemmatimonadota bacterium]